MNLIANRSLSDNVASVFTEDSKRMGFVHFTQPFWLEFCCIYFISQFCNGRRCTCAWHLILVITHLWPWPPFTSPVDFSFPVVIVAFLCLFLPFSDHPKHIVVLLASTMLVWHPTSRTFESIWTITKHPVIRSQIIVIVVQNGNLY